MIKKEPPPSEDGSSSCLLSYLSEPITAASARLWMPDSVLHTLPRTGEGRFSSHYRNFPQTHADVLKHLWLPIPHLHQWGTSGRYPMPFLAFTGAVVCSSKKIGEPYFCYYRLLPQVARTYLCTRNLSDSPIGREALLHGHSSREYPPDGLSSGKMYGVIPHTPT